MQRNDKWYKYQILEFKVEDDHDRTGLCVIIVNDKFFIIDFDVNVIES